MDMTISVQPPWIHRAVGDRNEIVDRLKESGSLGDRGRLYQLDGGNCATVSDCYDEFSKAIPLPAEFGRNLDALVDCLCDGDIVSGNPVFMMIVNADSFLMNESSETLLRFLEALGSTGARWSKGLGWPWNIGPTSFHTFFLFSSVEKSERFMSVDLYRNL